MATLTIARKVDIYIYTHEVENLPLTFELARELLGRNLYLGSCIHDLVAPILSVRHCQNLMPYN